MVVEMPPLFGRSLECEHIVIEIDTESGALRNVVETRLIYSGQSEV